MANGLIKEAKTKRSRASQQPADGRSHDQSGDLPVVGVSLDSSDEGEETEEGLRKPLIGRAEGSEVAIA